ncbi:hypothetical protein JCM16358_10980 [Halanaerocella petrolearia]
MENVIKFIAANVPLLSILLIILKKDQKKLDAYFRSGSFVLSEVDDILDSILLEYPDNPTLNTVDDVIGLLLKQLEKSGYKINQTTKAKIASRVKGKIKRDFRAKVFWENGELKLEYK